MTMARDKIRLHLAIDPHLAQWLDEWLESMEFPPSKTTVIEGALKRVLETEASTFEPGKKRGARG